MQKRNHRSSCSQSSWQTYQSKLKREAVYSKLKKKLFTYASIMAIIIVVSYTVPVGRSGTAYQQLLPSNEKAATAAVVAAGTPDGATDRTDSADRTDRTDKTDKTNRTDSSQHPEIQDADRTAVESASAEPSSPADSFDPPHPVLSADPAAFNEVVHAGGMRKDELQALLNWKNFYNLTRESVDIQIDGRHYLVDTSLDSSLQQFLLENMNRNHARYIGIVAVEPATGRVLAMAGFDSTNRSGNPCIEASFPAASVFKIVTAAAGIEKCGFQPSSRFALNGGKHTLYKSQINERVSKHTLWMSLKESFAHSVNPIFGRIGANHVGRSLLEKYAEAFGFNRHINFELPLAQSKIMQPEDTYQLAMVASGYNRDTTLSPLHGALMSAAILNKGVFIEPTIIDTITDEKGAVQYKSQPKTLRQAISADAATSINAMMLETVCSGTGRRVFKDADKDPILSRLEIGGKTGSMGSGEVPNLKFDWFVGFGEDKQSGRKIAVAAMVGHEKFIGTRSAYYARLAIQQYFGRYLEKLATVKTPDSKQVVKRKKKSRHAV